MNFLPVCCPSSLRKIIKQVELIYSASTVIKRWLHYQNYIVILGGKVSPLQGCRESFLRDTVGVSHFALPTILWNPGEPRHILGTLVSPTLNTGARHTESLWMNTQAYSWFLQNPELVEDSMTHFPFPFSKYVGHLLVSWLPCWDAEMNFISNNSFISGTKCPPVLTGMVSAEQGCSKILMCPTPKCFPGKRHLGLKYSYKRRKRGRNENIFR